MDKKEEKCDKRGFWYCFWHPEGTVAEPWATDEELMNSPHVKDFFENGTAEQLLQMIEKHNRTNNEVAAFQANSRISD